MILNIRQGYQLDIGTAWTPQVILYFYYVFMLIIITLLMASSCALWCLLGANWTSDRCWASKGWICQEDGLLLTTPTPPSTIPTTTVKSKWFIRLLLRLSYCFMCAEMTTGFW